MELRSAWFHGYSRVVSEQVAEFSRGMKGRIASIQVLSRNRDVSGIPTEIVLWYWATDPGVEPAAPAGEG